MLPKRSREVEIEEDVVFQESEEEPELVGTDDFAEEDDDDREEDVREEAKGEGTWDDS